MLITAAKTHDVTGSAGGRAGKAGKLKKYSGLTTMKTAASQRVVLGFIAFVSFSWWTRLG
ncbi:MAG: hypothetical protein EKK53_10960 [Burkholderiales bacterium]|nr:MAG: hypothetical protein EKK53_10960 [Burkholderiales bacterium]